MTNIDEIKKALAIVMDRAPLPWEPGQLTIECLGGHASNAVTLINAMPMLLAKIAELEGKIAGLTALATLLQAGPPKNRISLAEDEFKTEWRVFENGASVDYATWWITEGGE